MDNLGGQPLRGLNMNAARRSVLLEFNSGLTAGCLKGVFGRFLLLGWLVPEHVRTDASG